MTYLTDVLADIRDNWWIYAMMPLVAAAIGYVTKLVAVEMMFRPLEFKGIPPYLGWQGVIPRSAPRMASSSVDLLMRRILQPQDIIDEIDLDDLMVKLGKPMHDFVEELTREMMTEIQPTVWKAMPEAVQTAVIARVEQSVPRIMGNFLDAMKTNVDHVLDIRMLAVDALTRDKALTVKMIRTIGKTEMRFIVRVGIPFGFVLGIVQALVWALTHSPLIMPLFGAVTGLVTDWLALQMIFRPIHPKRFGLFTWQGLFIKRREEVTKDYTKLIAEEILSPANIFEALLTGPRSDIFLSMIDTEIQRAVDTQTAAVGPLVKFTVGNERYERMRATVSRTVVNRILDRRDEFGGLAAQAMDLPTLLASRMRLMTNEEFEGLLRPAFKQDEWKLVVVGAALGFLVGELQLHLFFS
ncbi:DUF445 domain-containing protein [Aldersonia sp. NBC_00410]|uniref:DUF445 domain-containing protein n=1 Tax=Aldersonia sp. NBC_00410 TaxID=2975954 RepID=UPI00225A7C98|nr:DUF445 domain-containing protein [Aldersonia sp. NBC_00410]MCX5042853.1 DUF445 domain-containing protein [Aldersonia sp. NBC_00410]